MNRGISCQIKVNKTQHMIETVQYSTCSMTSTVVKANINNFNDNQTGRKEMIVIGQFKINSFDTWVQLKPS